MLMGTDKETGLLDVEALGVEPQSPFIILPSKPAPVVDGIDLNSDEYYDESVVREMALSATYVKKKRALEEIIVPYLNKFYAVLKGAEVGSKGNILAKCMDRLTGRPVVAVKQESHIRTELGNITIDFIDGMTNKRRYLKLSTFWLSAHNRKSYQGVVYNPAPGLHPEIDSMFLNTFRPLYDKEVAAKAYSNPFYKRLITSLNKHIHYIVCNGSAVLSKYFVKWMAYKVQYPSRKTQTCLVLKGVQGCGKGTAIMPFYEMFGINAVKAERANEDVGGKFNAITSQENLRFLWLDELTKLKPGTKDVLKYLITEGEKTVEGKFLVKVRRNNFTDVVITTNNVLLSFGDKASTSQRRFVVIRCSNALVLKGQPAYTKDCFLFHKDDMACAALWYYLLNIDLTGFNPRIMPVQDRASTEMLYVKNSVSRWWRQALVEGVHYPFEYLPDKHAGANGMEPFINPSGRRRGGSKKEDPEEANWVGEICKRDLYLIYTKWCKATKEASGEKIKVVTSSKFWGYLAELTVLVTKKETRNGNRVPLKHRFLREGDLKHSTLDYVILASLKECREFYRKITKDRLESSNESVSLKTLHEPVTDDNGFLVGRGTKRYIDSYGSHPGKRSKYDIGFEPLPKFQVIASPHSTFAYEKPEGYEVDDEEEEEGEEYKGDIDRGEVDEKLWELDLSDDDFMHEDEF